MSTSLLLKKLLALSDPEYDLLNQTVKDKEWKSFHELISLFPEDDPELQIIRHKIEDYITPKTQTS